MPLKPGDILSNHYQIEGIIGKGAFGVVYRARDTSLERVVAIKELHKSAAELSSTVFDDYVRRFAREARVQAGLNHPHIVHVYQLIELEPQVMYLVMEYVDGGNLKQLLERKGQLPLDEALRLAREMLSGLAAVHADPRDIVHRDLKPSNVLLTQFGQAKLTDFGLAQVGDESLRSMGGAPHPGTPAYMSPEQETTSAYLYPASDIFSFGCMLFEMLAGAGYKWARRRRQTLLDLRSDIPDWLSDAVEAALRKDPDERIQTAEDMLEAIKGQPSLSDRSASFVGKMPSSEPQTRRVAVGQVAQLTTASAIQRFQSKILTLAPGVTMEFVRVPAGEFQMGSDQTIDKEAKKDETPQHEVFLDEYLIGKYPVTNLQYQVFVQSAGHQAPPHWKRGQIPKDKEQHPVVDVSWQDAAIFCEWLSQAAGRAARLPTEAEWEKAARGSDGRIFPWGNDLPDKTRCNFFGNVNDTTPVGRYSPMGDSPYGCADMAGNVWEWAADWYDGEYYASSPSRNPSGPASGGFRALRGGSWFDFGLNLRVANRGRLDPSYRYGSIGFRCALSP